NENQEHVEENNGSVDEALEKSKDGFNKKQSNNENHHANNGSTNASYVSMAKSYQSMVSNKLNLIPTKLSEEGNEVVVFDEEKVGVDCFAEMGYRCGYKQENKNEEMNNMSPRKVWTVQDEIVSAIKTTTNKFAPLQVDEEDTSKWNEEMIQYYKDQMDKAWENNKRDVVFEEEIELDENDVFVDKSASAKFMTENEVRDHSPAILNCPGIVKKAHKSFRLANYVTEKVEFGDSVRANWEKNFNGHAMYQLLFETQARIDKDPFNKKFREDEVKVLVEYLEATQDEEKLLMMRLKRLFFTLMTTRPLVLMVLPQSFSKKLRRLLKMISTKLSKNSSELVNY
ncbi:hypothetical protein Tco_1126669, partial [Tanacetum coccineum]